MANIAKVKEDYYFGEGKTSMLKREADLNNLLLQLTVILNAVVEWIDKQDTK